MYVGTNTAQYTTSTFVLTAFSDARLRVLFCVAGLRRLFTTYRIRIADLAFLMVSSLIRLARVSIILRTTPASLLTYPGVAPFIFLTQEKQPTTDHSQWSMHVDRLCFVKRHHLVGTYPSIQNPQPYPSLSLVFGPCRYLNQSVIHLVVMIKSKPRSSKRSQLWKP